MTDSIKPPGGPPSTPPLPAGVDGPREGRFRGALEGAAPPASTAPTAPSELSAVAAELRAGTLTPEAAVSRLLERHLGSGPARALTPVARAELERLLRARLEDDPALRALTSELGRAR